MTDTLAALRGLVFTGAESAGEALSSFESKWTGDSLVMDKWFAIQAMKPGSGTLKDVMRLMEHPEFSMRNPNKVRSLIGVFSMINTTGFHASDGSGYDFHARQVVALDSINPQIAARMAAAFNRWKRYDEGRRAKMKAALEQISATPGLSRDTTEMVTRILG